MRSLVPLLIVLIVVTSLTAPALGQPPGPRIETGDGGGSYSPTTNEPSSETPRNPTTTTTSTPEPDSESEAEDDDEDEETALFTESGESAYDGTCEDLGPFSRNICNGVLGAVKDLAESFLHFAQGIAEWAIEFLVSRPLPLNDGDPEYVDRPTNAPMDTVYDLWYSLGLPAGLAIWALSMLLFRANGLLPGRIITAHEARTLELKGWLALFAILGSWIWCAFLLHLASGLTIWFAPSGEEVIGSFDRIVDSALTAGIGALILALSSGVLFIFVALVFGLSWLAVYVLIPAMPVFIALGLPAIGLFRPVSTIGRQLRGLFAPSVFVPFPAAVILGVGYPVVNAIHASLGGGLSSFAGVDSFAYIILVLTMWFAAAVSPLILFVGSRHLRPFAALTAGGLGAVAGSQLANSSGTLRKRLANRVTPNRGSPSVTPNAGAGLRVDPLEGSPFTRSNGGGFGGGLTGKTPVGALEGGTANGISRTIDSESASKQSDDSHDTQIGEGLSDAYARTIPDGVEFKRINNRSELDQRRYDAGYFEKDGQFRSVIEGPSDSGWLLNEGGLNRVIEKRSDKDIVLYDPERSVALDARGAATEGKYRSARYTEQHNSSVQSVEGTKNR